MSTRGFVLAYLGVAVAANLAASHFGPRIVPLIAFLLIGFELSSRDALHERWHGRGLKMKIGGLILAGSALTILVNSGAWRVALASTLAFAGAAIIDTAVYSLLWERSRRVRMNGSNLASALVDSLIFPLVAFGMVPVWVIVGQWVAKTGGGAAWVWILTRRDE